VSRPPKNRRQGAALVEFALTALVLYLLLAGGVELGRSIFVSQVLQDAARVAARELSVTPISADCASFEDALANSCGADVQANIWNPNQLVIDISCGPTDSALQSFIDNLPLVNRALKPVFIIDDVVIGGTRRKLMRYPGALLGVTTPPPPSGTCPEAATDLTVGIPQVDSRTANGTETIEWIPVLAEVRGSASDVECGQFSFVTPSPAPSDCGPTYNPTAPRGIASVAINYPFQSGALTAFQQKLATQADPAHDAHAPNFVYAVEADDAGVTQTGSLPPGTTLIDPEPPDCPPGITCPGIYAGAYGLGRQYALAKTVRPYRSLLQGQALFRREVTN
jgi:hypothetical protein